MNIKYIRRKSFSFNCSLNEGKKAKYYTGYTVIPVDTFKSASTYRKYVQWDAVQSEDIYDEYTQDGDRFYFCLKGGFEFIKEDDSAYALSMIAVRIDITGELTGVYTRDMDFLDGEGDLELKSPEALEKILNMSFSKTFKPYPMYDAVKRVGTRKLLDSGVSPLELCTYEHECDDGYRIITVEGLGQNVTDENGKLLSPKQWFEFCEEAQCITYDKDDYIVKLPCDFFICAVGNKLHRARYKFLTKNGKIKNTDVREDMLPNIGSFIDGYAHVTTTKGQGVINTNGKLIGGRFFDWCNKRSDSAGTWAVIEDGLCNRISKNKGLISPKWFTEFGKYAENGYAHVILDEKHNFIDLDGNLLSPVWFHNAYKNTDGCITISVDGRENVVDENGNLLSDTYFDTVGNFKKGYATVKLDGMYNILSRDGKLMSPKIWFDFISRDFDGEKITADLDGERYFIYEDGTVVNTHE